MYILENQNKKEIKMKYTIDIELYNKNIERHECDNMQHVLYKLRIIEAEYKDTIKKIILKPELEREKC